MHEAKHDAIAEIHKTALEHSWNWTKYQAEQRLTMLRFYIVWIGFLFTGLFTVITSSQRVMPLVAAGICALGLLVTVCFFFLDRRHKNLIACGARAMKGEEEYLRRRTENQWIVMAMEVRPAGGSHHSDTSGILRILYGSLAVAFSTMLVLFLLMWRWHLNFG